MKRVCLLKNLLPLILLIFFATPLSTYAASGIWTDYKSSAYAGGNGSADSPFQIATAEQLAFLADSANADAAYSSGKYFVLTAEIDLAAHYWVPVGVFKGSFDGRGNKIFNLTINSSTSDYQGLFGQINSGAQISNLGLINCAITGQSCIGALTGYASTATITGCYSTGTINGYSANGGLVGQVDTFLSISYSWSSCSVTGTGTADGRPWTGGLIGPIWSGTATITNCYAAGGVTAYNNSGGLVALNYTGSVTITNCYSAGNIVTPATYWNNVGGIVGLAGPGSSTTITNCYASGTITGSDGSGKTGGILGGNDGSPVSVTNSYYNTANAPGQGGGAAMATSDMQTSGFVTTLNGLQSPEPWLADSSNRNNGFPILADMPGMFSFINQTGMPLSTYIVSNPVNVDFIASIAPISITGGEYTVSTDGGSTWGGWTSTSDNVSLNDQVMVRLTSGSTHDNTTSATLTIGTVTYTFSVTTAAASDPNATGLISWWKAENNALDSVGGNHGIAMNGATFATGQVNQAFSLDGVDDYLKVNASSSLDIGLSAGFSINMWINPHDISQQQPLIEWNNGSAWGTHFWISVPLTSGSGPGSLFANIMDTSGTFHYFSTAPNILTADTFQHVALTYDKTTGQASLYLNGTVVASQNLGIFIPQTSYDLFIGLRPSSGINPFNGLIDEVKIFNRALSALEVSTIAGTKPDAFTFTDQTGVALSTSFESNAITVTGITNPAAISITGNGGEYAINGSSSWTTFLGTVRAGDTVKVRQTSSSSFETTTDATLTIGGVSDTFSIKTITLPAVYSDNFTSGINPTHWSVSAGAYTIDSTNGDIRMSKPAGGGEWGSVRFNHDVYGDFDISVDYRDAILAGCRNQIQLNIAFGGQFVCNRRENWCASRYSVWLDPPGTTVGVMETADTSGTLRVTRVGSVVTFYANTTQIYQGSFNNSPVTHISFSLQNNATEDAISATFDNFIVRAADIVIPDAFSFIDQTGMPVSTLVTSNPVTVTGISNPAPISITGDSGSMYKINSGSWTDSDGTVNPDDTVEVQVTSSASNEAMTNATLTISGITDTFSVTTAAATDPNATGLISWWKADNNTLDSVGGNHGSLQNGAMFAAGRVGPAFSFDGVDDSVHIPNSSSLTPSGSFSIDAWIFPTADTNAVIVGKWGDDGDWANQRAYNLVLISGRKICFAISDAANQSNDAFHNFYTPDGSIALNSWNHIAAVYDVATGTRKIYINGSEEAIRTDTPINILNSVANLTIGAYQRNSTTYAAYFPGLIDEVAIYNRALSASDIAVLSGTKPDAFSFIDQTGVAIHTMVESNAIIVTGTSFASAISITGADGQYAIFADNGSTLVDWTNAPGTVSPGNKVKAHLTSSSSYETTDNATLTIGGVSDTFSVTTGPDPIAPTVTAFTLPETAVSAFVTITAFTATDNVAVTGYCLTETDNASLCSWSGTSPDNYTFSGIPQGVPTVKTLYARARDAKGNVSASVSDNVTITIPDTTAPTVTAFTLPATATSATVSITSFTATDNIAVTGYCLSETDSSSACTWSGTAPASYTFSGIPSGVPTDKTLYARARDAAGNPSSSVARTVTITIPTPPTTTTTSVMVTTTTTPASTTTTTTTVKKCPLLKALNSQANDDVVTLYRIFRDKRLAQTEAGTRLIVLYYKHAVEVSEIFDSRHDLNSEAQRLLLSLAPNMFFSMYGDREISIAETAHERVVYFLEQLKDTASPALQADIDELLMQLADGSLQSELGYKVR